jgi:hypothetical protein
MPDIDRPTLTDPAIITARDGTFFVCWVEPVEDRDRWIFISRDRVRYTGPSYEGQNTLPVIRDLVANWWDSTRQLEQAG